MQIQVMSDLHFAHRNWHEFIEPLVGGEVLVLAGDIMELAELGRAKAIFAAFAKKFGDVLYVPGNHEFYETNPTVAYESLERIVKDIPNFRLLKAGEPVTVNGQRFLGDTMWFPDTPVCRMLEGQWSDFFCIQNLRPWGYQQNQKFIEFLDKELKTSDVVVTHHLPSFKSVSSKYKNNIFNAFFVSDVEKLIAERQPKLWIHGHTHQQFDYDIGSTRVYCNPLGYPREGGNAHFFDRVNVRLAQR